eukprot:GCRY01004520.1.p1 GENE.GCRY01004520.1~~GCRY01004520.1.p1  ORF type:complete len:320 (-),score=38.58 GCRY01004520.1:33-992(-)
MTELAQEDVGCLLFGFFGCLFLFAGKKLVKPCVFLGAGLFVFGVFHFLIFKKYIKNLSQAQDYGISASVGLSAGFLALYIIKVGLFALVSLMGYLASIVFLTFVHVSNNTQHTSLILGFCLIPPVLALLFFEKFCLVLASALGGGLGVVNMIDKYKIHSHFCQILYHNLKLSFVHREQLLFHPHTPDGSGGSTNSGSLSGSGSGSEEDVEDTLQLRGDVLVFMVAWLVLALTGIAIQYGFPKWYAKRRKAKQKQKDNAHSTQQSLADASSVSLGSVATYGAGGGTGPSVLITQGSSANLCGPSETTPLLISINTAPSPS